MIIVIKKFGLISKIPKQIQKNDFPIYRGYANYGCIDCIFEGREEKFVLDTGASRKGKNKNLYATSFLDGTIFDKLKYEKLIITMKTNLVLLFRK